jgi:hypothetical protein
MKPTKISNQSAALFEGHLFQTIIMILIWKFSLTMAVVRDGGGGRGRWYTAAPLPCQVTD